jgi:DNA-binding SARP family transcriptional activator/TolB-like protein/Flp pilus assembly protein TadD
VVVFRLITLGSPALTDRAGAEIRSVLAQPKRLAVLAYIATEGSQGFVRRETLLALFWPDADVESARQALRQTLYHLRRETAEDVFVARSADEITVNRGVLWCDATEFDHCAGDRRFVDAMAVYRGDFLPAFAFANQSAEFEQWLEGARARYRSKAAAAASTLRDETERAGDRDAASAWGRVAAQLAPDDERATRRLIEVLDAGGDRGGALRAYDEFSRHLWSAYETRPSAETAALVADVRARSEAPVATPTATTAANRIDRVAESNTVSRVVVSDTPPAAARATPTIAATASASRVPDPPQWGRRRTPRTAIVGGVLVAAVVAGGWLLAHRMRPGTSAASTPTLAVLPFAHDGPATDGYLASGITDDIRSRLAALPGLRVIAGASSEQYTDASAGVQRIGRELGVEYLLMGRVVRAGPGDSTHVRVTPELIRVSDATTAWTVPFDAAPTDLVGVQGRVAEAVVQALNVRVNDSARAALARLPTVNSAAYDAYLHGSNLFASGPADAAVLHRAVAELERAVALDTNFAPAWAQLAVARTRLYENSGSLQRSDILRARVAAERALALDSTLPNARAAMAGYYSVGENDQIRALRELRIGLRSSPRDAALLILVAISERALGQWDSAVVHLQQARAFDPRSETVLYDLGVTLFLLRRFPEAHDVAVRAVQLSPGPQGWQLVAMIPLANGDLPAARAVMTHAGRTEDPTTLVTFVATYGDLYWALDDSQRALLLRLTPTSFGDDRFNWSYALAGMSWLAGDSAAMRAYADTALREGAGSVRNDPTEPQTHALLGVANAYLGRRDDALREARLAVTLCPLDKDAVTGTYVLQQLARVYVMLGQDDRAVETLSTLLRVPSYVSVGWLRVDPTYAPLKRNAGFRRLIGE